MSWVAAAAVGGSVVTGMMGSNAANKASQAQVDTTRQGIAEQSRQYDQTRADNAPFMQTGTAANRRLGQLLGISSGVNENDPRYTAIRDSLTAAEDKAHQGQYGMSIFDARSGLSAPGARSQFDDRIKQQANQQYLQQYGNQDEGTPGYGSLTSKFSAADLEADPVYQSGLKFGLDRGTEGINARATAGGMYDSGATLKALTQFGNDYGSTKANESFNRFNVSNDSIYNKLAGVSGAGQQATGQVNAAGANMANNVSNSLEGAGNARAAGIVGGANAWGGAAGGVNNAMNTYQSNQTLQALLKRNGGGGSPTSNFDYTGWTAAGGDQYG